jgi:hypothetical protein
MVVGGPTTSPIALSFAFIASGPSIPPSPRLTQTVSLTRPDEDKPWRILSLTLVLTQEGCGDRHYGCTLPLWPLLLLISCPWPLLLPYSASVTWAFVLIRPICS